MAIDWAAIRKENKRAAQRKRAGQRAVQVMRERAAQSADAAIHANPMYGTAKTNKRALTFQAKRIY